MSGIIALCVVAAVGIGFIVMIWRGTSERATKRRHYSETRNNRPGDDYNAMSAHGHDNHRKSDGDSSGADASPAGSGGSDSN